MSRRKMTNTRSILAALSLLLSSLLLSSPTASASIPVRRRRQVSHATLSRNQIAFSPESQRHYLQENATANPDTGSSDDHDEHEDKPWGEAILVALIVNVATLTGVIVLVPSMMARAFCRNNASTPPETLAKRRRVFLYNIIPSFACGALLATAVLLIIPESILLLATATGAVVEEHDHRRHLGAGDSDEPGMAWRFGTAFMAGFLLPVLLGSVFPHVSDEEVSSEAVNGNDDDNEVDAVNTGVAIDGDTMPSACDEEGCAVCDTEAPAPPTKAKTVVTPPPRPINWRLASSVLIGDFFHNFADGIFLGNAFLLCSSSLAWAMAASTIYHELAQELADYFLLTTQVGFPPWKALIFNAISGLSVLFGVIVIFSLNVSSLVTGSILAMSAGVYVFIAAAECLPRIEKEVKTLKARALSTACFAMGAIPIGLVLLNHGHCEA